MHHADIIERLGGLASVAEGIGAHPSRVGRWRAEGIPASRWPAVVAFARTAGADEVTFDALEAGARLPAAPPLRRGRKPRAGVSL